LQKVEKTAKTVRMWVDLKILHDYNRSK